VARLGFLAAKAAAHAPDFALDFMNRYASNLRHHFVLQRGDLTGGVHDIPPSSGRLDQTGLALRLEMLLPRNNLLPAQRCGALASAWSGLAALLGMMGRT